MKLVLLLALAACAPGTPALVDGADPVVDGQGPDGSDQPGPPWRLVWQDEFDGAANTRPDAAKWRHDVGGGGWGNNQLEFDPDRPENAAHDGQGNLAITARREDFGGRSYTSARLITRGQFARAYGRFDARLKLPRGQGIWPAFWLLGDDLGAVGWPQCGEIDIMEYRGQEPRKVRGSLHGPGYSGGGNHGRDTDTGVDLSQDFHLYTVEWDPGRVVWKIDGEPYFAAVPQDLPGGAEWVYDHPFFMILNVAVGGDYVGAPSGSTTFPQTMLVDYVRVYERIP